ncbi:MAG: methyltransferase RsmF C-terminal domain-like protein [Bacteroidia bacterium]
MKDLPKQLLESLRGLPGYNESNFIEAHRQENRITSIRLNPFKLVELDFEVNEPVKWCKDAYYLNERPSFTHDPLFQAGCYYVQEAGSMFLEHAIKSSLDLSQPLKMLDLCASPGGKSTLINSLISPDSLLIANEVVKQRADILAQNLSKWGTCNTIVTNNDPQKFLQLESFFDAIVVDAPCSGSGLFRKQPEAIDEWSIENVNLCSSRQKRILADIIPCLKENGVLIYSTCSYSFAEDEAIVNWLISDFDMEYVSLSVNKEWGIIETESGYRFYPHLTKSEGFFLAVLRKKEENFSFKPQKVKETALSAAEMGIISGFIDVKDKYFYRNGQQYHAMNRAAYEFMVRYGKNFYLKKAGVALGEIKGKDLVPNQELAWSVDARAPKVGLDKSTALKYLKKEGFTVEQHVSGFSLISYMQQGLGWAKILPSRINNYLPNELRILN